jgi:hypothetical protein
VVQELDHIEFSPVHAQRQASRRRGANRLQLSLNLRNRATAIIREAGRSVQFNGIDADDGNVILSLLRSGDDHCAAAAAGETPDGRGRRGTLRPRAGSANWGRTRRRDSLRDVGLPANGPCASDIGEHDQIFRHLPTPSPARPTSSYIRYPGPWRDLAPKLTGGVRFDGGKFGVFFVAGLADNPFGLYPPPAATVSACRCRWNSAVILVQLVAICGMSVEGAGLTRGIQA